jgi:hypothetical protein
VKPHRVFRLSDTALDYVCLTQSFEIKENVTVQPVGWAMFTNDPERGPSRLLSGLRNLATESLDRDRLWLRASATTGVQAVD